MRVRVRLGELAVLAALFAACSGDQQIAFERPTAAYEVDRFAHSQRVQEATAAPAGQAPAAIAIAR